MLTKPRFAPKTDPASITTNVCSVIGTGPTGMENIPLMASSATNIAIHVMSRTRKIDFVMIPNLLNDSSCRFKGKMLSV
jgi:hypothetical protein